ncbi:arginine--tRNA ligase [Candidatus Endobugula sertula]|uniref:Arginine--tRNA ligase n=1 Tax=Candidatus Endobugula sertula TaxID=62101 RepID=A0A1D2QQ08_9GAMM|nr:arginine--tRNA ligase [Candidatus Endobugula sertula]
MNIRDLLNQRFTKAMQAAGLPSECQPHVTPSKASGKKSQFGEYQANGAMAAAKIAKAKPVDIAQRIVNQLNIDDLASQVDIAGPGFINITLKPEWLAREIVTVNQNKNLSIQPPLSPQTVVVDYSSPNLAKEMHVGHLRSTIIGDAIVRTLEFQGHKVIRQNHVGDWGTQFGMLIAELEEQLQDGESATLALKDLERFYQRAKKHFDDSENFANKARDYVVKLQSNDEKTLSLWKQFKQVSLAHSQEIYTTLNVSLTEQDVYGESAYNDDLGILVDELCAQKLAIEDQGAQVVFLEEMPDKDGSPSPVIIRKQDGGFLYATTDLAAIRYRANSLNADRILYFIDARQSLHMQQVFTIARKATFVNNQVSLEHHAFGTMMGNDGKPFKTRSGGTVKLADLLEEAIERAEKIVAEKNTELSDSERKEIAQKVGVGAIKYADLSKTRTNDYIFNWESMLSFEGNTAPYLQYAYTRIQSIFRKAGVTGNELNTPITLTEDAEIALAVKTLQFSEVIEQVTKEAYPHLLCHYIYDLAGLFMRFYEQCPILKEGIDETTKNSRLQLLYAIANTLGKGLDLLGIDTMDRM